ncbi:MULTISPECIES: ferredoxin [unclassified Streptomyces]|uniref:ferredoxin n=1 Tax=unclassified Streptomyces TaxID=2593676 RepID=UPI00278BEA41|nr:MULTISPECIES: ferredoxin [unclassified Streptomyces]
MHIIVDTARCEGHGMCEERADQLFRLDDEGDLHLVHGDQAIPTDLEDDARSAVGVCPVAALRVRE